MNGPEEHDVRPGQHPAPFDDAALDEQLEATFPASDPPACMIPTTPGPPRGK